MLSVLLSLLVTFQDPRPPSPQGERKEPPKAADASASPAPAPLPAPRALTDAEAKLAAETLQKALKAAKTMAEKHRALDDAARGAHAALVKPIAQVVETEKSVVVRKRAAEILGLQPAAAANPAIVKLIRSPRVEDSKPVVAALVASLARCGYTTAQWKEIEDLFERDYAPENVPVQEAVLALIGQHKEKQAIELLLRNMDEPIPANVDDAANPPAEYWEARWKAWSSWRSRVRDTVYVLTGQRFSTASEAKAWLRNNPLK